MTTRITACYLIYHILLYVWKFVTTKKQNNCKSPKRTRLHPIYQSAFNARVKFLSSFHSEKSTYSIHALFLYSVVSGFRIHAYHGSGLRVKTVKVFYVLSVTCLAVLRQLVACIDRQANAPLFLYLVIWYLSFAWTNSGVSDRAKMLVPTSSRMYGDGRTKRIDM